MLLLILFAGCLSLCAAQTTFISTSAMETPTMTPAPFTQSIQATSMMLTSNSHDNSHKVVAILLAAIQSYKELNDTTLAPVLNELSNIIKQIQPDMNFSLTLKNITRV